MVANGRESTDSIPPELTKCRSLLWLNLRDNRLMGELPHDFSLIGSDTGTVNLEMEIFPPIDFGDCNLMLPSWILGKVAPSENIPVDTQDNWQHCRTKLLAMLRGTIATLAYWELSNHKFTGPIPVPIAGKSNLSALLLSDNKFSGPIPEELSGFPMYNIDLTNNNISGSIPDIFLELAPTLQSLQLANNNLSGYIPSSLNQLRFLFTYNFSFNPELQGPVPDKAGFQNFDPDAFLNDTKLCLNADGTTARTPSGNMTEHPQLCENMGVPTGAPVDSFSGISATEDELSDYISIAGFGLGTGSGFFIVVVVIFAWPRAHAFVFGAAQSQKAIAKV